MPTNLPVGVDLVVIPDGVTGTGAAAKAHFCVIATPTARPGAKRVADLADWPATAMKKLGQLRLILGDIEGTQAARIVKLRAGGSLSPTLDALGDDAAAGRLFQRIFQNDAGLQGLLKSIEDNGGGDPEGDDGHQDLGPPQRRFGSYDTGLLGRFADELYGVAAATSLAHRLASATASAGKLRSGAPDVLSGRPSVQWWRGFKEQWLGLGQALPSSHRAPGLTVRQFVDAEMARAASGPAVTTFRSKSSSQEGWFRSQLTNGRYWLDGDAGWRGDAVSADSVRQQRFTDTTLAVRQELAAFEAAWALADEALPAPKFTQRSAAEDAAANAARKFSALLSYPTLAKFLRLCVDVEVDLSAVAGGELAADARAYGAVAGAFADDLPSAGLRAEDLMWTSFVYASQSQIFAPCARVETITKAVDAAQPFIDGLLNLAQPLGPIRRYEVQTVDVTTGIAQLQSRAEAINGAHAKGLAQHFQDTALPELPTRGLAIVDRDAENEAKRSGARRDEMAALLGQFGTAGVFLIRDADDLVEGFRIDAGLATQGGDWTNKDRWRPLTARDIAFKDPDISAVVLAAYAGKRYRDDGRVRRGVRTTASRLGASGPAIIREVPVQELFAWTGEGLAVPSRREATPADGALEQEAVTGIAQPHADNNLAVTIHYDLPTEASRQTLPLREMRSYIFGARLVYGVGCSLTFDSAVRRLVDRSQTAVTLGASPDTAYPFERRVRIHAPDVLLPWNDRIVTSDPVTWIGEAVDVLVVRSSETDDRERARRFLSPPRGSFDLSEQAGAFDARRHEHKPSGAFEEDYGARLNKETGDFPIARNGKIELTPPATAGATPKESSRGAVFAFSPDAPAPKQPVYPDPWARRTAGKFVPKVGTGKLYGKPSRAVEFWSETASPSKARPVVLELTRAKEGQSSDPVAYVDESDRFVKLAPPGSGLQKEFPKLRVALMPAETIELEIWSGSEASKMAQLWSVSAAKELLKRPEVLEGLLRANSDGAGPSASAVATAVRALTSRDPKVALQALEAALAEGPIAGGASARRIRLVHAVDRPMKTPTFLRGGSITDQPVKLKAIPLTVGGGPADQTAIVRRWSDFVQVTEATQPDPMTWTGQEGGAVTFLVGGLTLHAPSTGKLRCEAFWQEFRPDSLVYDPIQDIHRIAPKPWFRELFVIDEVGDVGPDRVVDVDLLRDEKGALRTRSFTFDDGRARKIALQLIGTSRFTDYFPKVPDAEAKLAGIGRYERGGDDVAKTSEFVWSPCTFRPPQPVIDRILPTYRWTRDVEGRVISWSRQAVLRAYVKDWWKSGEGEALALVQSDEPLTDAKAKYLDKVTRWGADPIYNSVSPEDIPETSIRGHTGVVNGLLLTDQEAGVDPGAAKVKVFPYAPKLDPQDGLYCDIDIRPGDGYQPFVQLGLARYQAHAIEGLQLSPPRVAWAQVPPSRSGSVTFRNRRDFTMRLSGVGFHDGAQDVARRTPLLNVRLMRAAEPNAIPRKAGGAIRWRPVLDPAGNPIERLHAPPTSQTGAKLEWTLDFRLPDPRTLVAYALMIDEVELTWFDDPANELGDCKKIPQPRLEESGPLFSHLIDLRPQSHLHDPPLPRGQHQRVEA